MGKFIEKLLKAAGYVKVKPNADEKMVRKVDFLAAVDSAIKQEQRNRELVGQIIDLKEELEEQDQQIEVLKRALRYSNKKFEETADKLTRQTKALQDVMEFERRKRNNNNNKGGKK